MAMGVPFGTEFAAGRSAFPSEDADASTRLKKPASTGNDPPSVGFVTWAIGSHGKGAAEPVGLIGPGAPVGPTGPPLGPVGPMGPAAPVAPASDGTPSRSMWRSNGLSVNRPSLRRRILIPIKLGPAVVSVSMM